MFFSSKSSFDKLQGLRALLLFGAISYLSYLTYGGHYPRITDYLLVWGLLWIIFIVRLSKPSKFILCASIFARLITFFSSPPYEDDYFRYLWDGFIFWQSGNPYQFSPQHFFSNNSLPSYAIRLLDGINFPELPTIYGPSSQLAFLIAHIISPGSLYSWRIVIFACEMWTIRSLSKGWGLCAAQIYALCPLIILEFSFGLHVDALAVALLAQSYLFYKQEQYSSSGVMLGLATGSKAIALIAGAGMLLKHPRKIVPSFLLTMALLYSPFLFSSNALAGLSSSQAMLSNWEYNSFMLPLVRLFVEESHARTILIFSFVTLATLLCIRSLRKRLSVEAISQQLMLSFLIFSPVLQPWYVGLALVPCAISPNIAGLALSAAVSLANINGTSLKDMSLYPHNHPWYVRPLEATLFLSLILSALIIKRFRKYSLKNWHARSGYCRES